MLKNKISVIVPVYNVEDYLENCIKSILQQTYSNLEILLVNDGSTDSSLDICNEYALLDNRIKVYNKKNMGVSAARNYGIEKSTGAYIGFVDSDDWIEPEMFERLYKIIEEKNTEICVLKNIYRDSQKFNITNIGSEVVTKQRAIKELLSYNFPASLWTSLYKKSLIAEIRLSEDTFHLEDLEFQFKAICAANTVSLCDTPLYNYRTRSGSANNSGFNNKIVSCFNILPSIEEYIIQKKVVSQKYIAALNARLLLTVSAFLSKSNSKDDKLEKYLESSARNIYFKTLITNIPLKKKFLITLLAISYATYAIPYRILKKNEGA
ncbi:glycosyltransferase family 2 protein [Rossellomorea sp. H39__3]